MKQVKLIFAALIALVMLTGCRNSLEAILDRAEFEDDEAGCVSVTGSVKLGTGTFGNGDGHLIYKKVKEPGEGSGVDLDCSL